MQDDRPWSPPGPPDRPRSRLWLWTCLMAAVAGLVLALLRAFPEAMCTPQDWFSLAWGIGLLVLLSAGVFRARSALWSDHLRHVALWAGIVALLALGVTYRGELAGVGRRLQVAFSGGDPVAMGEHEIAVPQSQGGSFIVVAKVNGQRVRFIVDTGATGVVLSPDDARRIGVDMAGLRYTEVAETANGIGYGAPLTADRLEVGPIAMSDFKMSVNQAPMSASLLGMSFLRRLESFRVEDHKLVLRWRDGG
jgi:aspartyl protease family protein